MKKIVCIIGIVICVTLSIRTNAQQISIDRGVRANGLWCFPLVTDSMTYLYLPDRAMLALDEKKQPQFSLIRYATSEIDTTRPPEETITKAGGGAVLHFLVTYDTDEKKIRTAEQELKQITKINEVKLRGPIVFKEGRYALISSILTPAGKPEKALLAMGAAPVLEGSRIALSFEMDPMHSQLLLESFMTNTPDVSLVFDFIFSGLTDAYNAKLTVDWSEVSKYEKIGGGVTIYFVSADVEKTMEELKKTSAIKLESVGEDSRMEALVTNAYNKVADMIFRRVEPEQLPASDQGGLNSLLGGLIGNNGAASSSRTIGFGAHFGYVRRDHKMSGSSVLNFNSRISTDRHHYVVFNIGDFYKKYGQRQDYFRTVNLEQDITFLKRVIYVGVDGAMMPEFDKMINNVTVTLKKVHTNGNPTIQEMNITRSSVADSKNISMSYGVEGDSDKVEWLNYEFKAQYNFKGGKSYQTDWIKQNSAMINLFAPYERRLVKLEGDADLLKSKNVRAITIRIEYPFFGDKKVMEMTVRPEEKFAEKQFDITLPAGQYAYKYTMRWRMKDGTEKVLTGENDTEILFIDILPDR